MSAFVLRAADHDDRVVPLHSFKLIATLQHVLCGPPDSCQRNPLAIRIDVKAGHGAGKPTAKILAEAADLWGFAAKCLGAKWTEPQTETASAPATMGASQPGAAAAAAKAADSAAAAGEQAGVSR